MEKIIEESYRYRFVTYCMPRSFNGINIPIPIQSAYLRDYADRNNLVFSLPVAEICFNESYYSLANIFRNLGKDEHFGAVSILVLPLENEILLQKILDLLTDKSIIFHFPLEGIVGSIKTIYDWRDNFLLMNRFKLRSENLSKYLEQWSI